jgi:hypothetical protein
LNFLHDPPPPDQRRYMQSYAKLIAKHLDTVVMQSVPGTCTVPILRIQHYIVSDASIPPGPGLSEPRTESSHAHSRMCVLYGDEVMNTGHGGGGGGVGRCQKAGPRPPARPGPQPAIIMPSGSEWPSWPGLGTGSIKASLLARSRYPILMLASHVRPSQKRALFRVQKLYLHIARDATRRSASLGRLKRSTGHSRGWMDCDRPPRRVRLSNPNGVSRSV